MADELADAGYPRVDGGGVAIPTISFGGIVGVVDPSHRTPAMSYRACVNYLAVCMQATKKVEPSLFRPARRRPRAREPAAGVGRDVSRVGRRATPPADVHVRIARRHALLRPGGAHVRALLREWHVGRIGALSRRSCAVGRPVQSALSLSRTAPCFYALRPRWRVNAWRRRAKVRVARSCDAGGDAGRMPSSRRSPGVTPRMSVPAARTSIPSDRRGRALGLPASDRA
jgi:hypothetical protein